MRRKQNKYTTIAGILLVMVVLFLTAQNLKNFKILVNRLLFQILFLNLHRQTIRRGGNTINSAKAIMKHLNEILANLNDEQKQLLADTINHGGWGDAEVEFNNNEIAYGDGYITDEAYKANHFERRSLSNRFRSLFKALGLDGSRYKKQSDEMCWMYDWWGDGTGSILFIREGLSTEFEKWAKEYNK